MVSSIVNPCEYNICSLTFVPLLSQKQKSIESILLPYYDGARSPLIQLPPVDLDIMGFLESAIFTRKTIK